MSQFGLSRSASEAFFDMAKTTPCFDSSTNVYQRKNLTLAKELIKRESISNDPTDPMAQRLISRVNDRADCA